MVQDALSRGAVPLFDEAPSITASAVKRAHIEHKLASVWIALNNFEGEVQRAESDVATAKNQLRAAAEAVMIAEADEIAVEIEDAEAAVLVLRARLGGTLSPVGQLRGISAATQRVISSINVEAFMRNPALEQEAQRALHVWRAFSSALETDSDAELSFEQSAGDASRAA